MVGGEKEKREGRRETGEEEMVVFSEGRHVPDHIPRRKDISLFASIMLPFAETGNTSVGVFI